MKEKQSRFNIAMWVFLAFITYFLVTEHWAHIVPFLPWLILAACPLMHIFMHGGHGGGHGGHGGGDDSTRPGRHDHGA